MKEEGKILGKTVTVIMDRPMGTYHPKHKDMYYPVNYGYVPGIIAGDGEEQDAYVLGVNEPLQEFTGVVIAVIHRKDDVEEKWVVAPEGATFSKEEIWEQVKFQEQYFQAEILMMETMHEKLIDLTEEQSEYINEQLHLYDKEHIKYRLDGGVQIGIEKDGELIGGLNAYMTAFHILYVDTLFVAEAYRRQGIGKKLILETEKRAKELGANMIRLDTFDWQGYEFYKRLGYEEVGHYYNDKDDFHEYFFVKRI